jgi:hypothetical protein
MSKSKKTEHIKEALTKGIQEELGKKASKLQAWIKSRDKETKAFETVGKGLDIKELDRTYTNECWYNCWHGIVDKEGNHIGDEKIAKIAKKLSKTFFRSGYTLGLKYPFVSKSGNSISYAILKYEN